MAYQLETEDWVLKCFMDWAPKSHQETCDRCNGKGEVGGGFKSLSDPEPCPQCFGTRTVTKGPRTPRPDLPPAIVEHMRRAWFDYFHGKATGKPT
jgi:DnaJ-class molecular chaperone